MSTYGLVDAIIANGDSWSTVTRVLQGGECVLRLWPGLLQRCGLVSFLVANRDVWMPSEPLPDVV